MPKSWGSVARRGAHVVRSTGPATNPAPTPSGPPPPQDEWVRVDDDAELATHERVEPRRPAPEIPGDVASAIRRSASEATAYRREKLVEQMGRAMEAYDRHRFEEAGRLAGRLADEVPDVPEVREVAGLAAYRSGQWRGAGRHLEAFRNMRDEPMYLPVEMDCARALGKPRVLAGLFEELRQSSPDPDVLAEGRLVLAGSLADQGKLAEAIDLLESNGAGKARRNPAERHLRQWYLLGDLYDRSGDAPRARAFFTMVAVTDPGAYDVNDRLKDLGPTRKPRSRKPKGDAKK